MNNVLEELQKRFPKAKLPPHVDCPSCRGRGIKNVQGRGYACECLFISPELMDIFRDASRSVVEKWEKEGTE